MGVMLTKIFWKRTYLFIEYDSNKMVDLSLAKIKKVVKDKKKNIVDYVVEKEIVMETKQLDKNKYRSKLNITIAEGRQLLKPDKYDIIVNHDSNNRPNISENILLNIEDFSRVFLYSNSFYGYIANFKIDDKKNDNGVIAISLNTKFMKENKHPYDRKIRNALEEAKDFKTFLKRLFLILAKWFINAYYQIVSHITRKNGRQILFMSENRTKIMDNLEAIDRRLKERGLDKSYKISYSFRNIFDKQGKNVFEWIKVINKIAKADVIFVDDYVPIFNSININKKQTLVQVWHAGFGFKLVGYGRFGIAGSPRLDESCHRKYTYGLIGNDNLKEIYSEVWGVEKEALLPTGMPRLEHFLDKSHMEEVRKDFYQKYPNLKNKKIITFAPTYRGYSQFDAYYDYNKIDFDELYEYCKKTDSAVVFGKHHFIKQEIPIKDEYKDLIFDMSYMKLNDLFYVTDVLVTDYSSAFYDFLLLNKPVLFYVYDKALYSATRGVHRPIDDVAPGKVCESFDALMDALYNKDYGTKEKADFLVDNCLTNTKLASDQVIDYVILKKGDFESCRK